MNIMLLIKPEKIHNTATSIVSEKRSKHKQTCGDYMIYFVLLVFKIAIHLKLVGFPKIKRSKSREEDSCEIHKWYHHPQFLLRPHVNSRSETYEQRENQLIKAVNRKINPLSSNTNLAFCFMIILPLDSFLQLHNKTPLQ